MFEFGSNQGFDTASRGNWFETYYFLCVWGYKYLYNDSVLRQHDWECTMEGVEAVQDRPG